MRRNIGSPPNGLTLTRCLVWTLTTAGVTLASIGASDGSGWPLTTVGSAAIAGTVAAAAGAAWAGASRPSRIAVAAKPPKAAAGEGVSRVGSGRIAPFWLEEGCRPPQAQL